MRIEHWGYQVEDPNGMAEWYCKHLGFTVKRGSKEGTKTHFLLDESGQVMIEFYHHPQIELPNYKSMDPLIWHLAFACENVPETTKVLQAAGATLEEPIKTTKVGDTLVMLRDPWGMAIQLCHREAAPML